MQKYIGNILVNNLNYKVDKCFQKVKSLEEINNDLPLLIIGLDNAKSLISDFNILKREYDDNKIWWTLSKTEKRVDYDKNISDFYDFCIRNITNMIKYTNINIFELNFGKIRRCLKYVLNQNIPKKYYVDNNKFIFVYDMKDSDNVKNIYGFSLNTVSFFGKNKQKILSFFEKNPKNTKISNFYEIPNNIKRLINDAIPSEMILLEYFTEK